jgi:hypothetical protein
MNLFLYLNIKSLCSLFKEYSKLKVVSEVWKQLIFGFVGLVKLVFVFSLTVMNEIPWNWIFLVFVFLDFFPKLVFPAHSISQISSIIRVYISKSRIIKYVILCLVFDPFIVVSGVFVFFIYLFSDLTILYFLLAIIFCVIHNILTILTYFYSVFEYLIIGFFYALYLGTIGLLFLTDLTIIVSLVLLVVFVIFILFIKFFKYRLYLK